jgi:hypothetical protein
LPCFGGGVCVTTGEATAVVRVDESPLPAENPLAGHIGQPAAVWARTKPVVSHSATTIVARRLTYTTSSNCIIPRSSCPMMWQCSTIRPVKSSKRIRIRTDPFAGRFTVSCQTGGESG